VRSEVTGLEISTSAPQMAAAVDRLAGELLRYGNGAGRFLADAAADPDCAIGNALSAALHLFTTTRDGVRRAEPHLLQAEASAPSATPREQLFVAAVRDWCDGRLDGAIERHRAILERWPTDLLSLKLVTYHQLSRGDFGGMLRTIRAVMPANGRNSHVGGMLAFALAQAGRCREAEAAGRRAAAAARDPWAQHAVAHVLDISGAAEEGAAFMAAHSGDWEQCSSFLYTHNWWHSALFRLALGDAPGALRLYDERVWTRRKDYCQDQINAVALLARLELAGVDVGGRWSEVAQQVAPRAGDHLDGFLDLHYALALARAGLTARLDELCRGLDRLDEVDARRASVHRQAVRAIAAYGAGDWAGAARGLLPVRASLALLGGSDVQRELFDLILIDSLRRAGRHVEAERLENGRRGWRAEAAWQRRAIAATIQPRHARLGAIAWRGSAQ